MPLHTDDPVFMRLMFDCFDHSVRGDCGNAQAVTHIPDGLVMRRVDLHVESPVWSGKSGNGGELSNCAARLDPRGMHGVRRIRRKSISTVLDAGAEFPGDVLIERAPQKNVEALATIANSKHWFPRMGPPFPAPESRPTEPAS